MRMYWVAEDGRRFYADDVPGEGRSCGVGAFCPVCLQIDDTNTVRGPLKFDRVIVLLDYLANEMTCAVENDDERMTHPIPALMLEVDRDDPTCLLAVRPGGAVVSRHQGTEIPRPEAT